MDGAPPRPAGSCDAEVELSLVNDSGTNPMRPPGSPGVDARVRELVRRIEELESTDDSAFGRFGAADWIACVLLALLVPVAILLWFAR